MIPRAALLGLAALVCTGTVAPAAAQGSALAVAVEPGTGAPVITVGPVLADEALAEAVRSGLPLRLRFTVELWRDELFDDLISQSGRSAVLAYEPLERLYLVAEDDDAAFARLPSYEAARASVERGWSPPVRPTRRGRYYYIVTLEVETLSLSDLDELERWLRGELEPAVRGSGSVPGAVGSGVKRLLIRILDLPARRFTVRSPRFDRP